MKWRTRVRLLMRTTGFSSGPTVMLPAACHLLLACLLLAFLRIRSARLRILFVWSFL